MKLLTTYIIFLILSVILNPKHGVSQNYADKDYYLVDSLVLESISNQDKILIDSILTLYHKENSDTIKLNHISEIVENSWDDNLWPKYNEFLYNQTQEILSNPKLSTKEKLFVKKIAASAINNMGYLYSSRGQFEEAIEYYFKSLQIQKSLRNSKDIAVVYNNIGRVYDQQGLTQQALKYYFKALKILEKINNIYNIGVTSNNIGLVYIAQGDFDMAAEYLNKSLKAHSELNNYSGIALAYNNLGYLYSKKLDHENTLKYYKLCLAMREESNDIKLTAYSLNNIGYVYAMQNNNDSAFFYYNRSVKILENINDKNGLAFGYVGLGKLNFNLGKKELAKDYALKGFKISEEINSPEKIKNSAILLSNIYDEEKDYYKALKYHKIFTSINDSLNNESTRNSSMKQVLEYKFEKKALADSLSRLESQKIKDLKYNQELKQQKSYTYMGAIGVILMILVIVVVLRGYQIKKKSNLELELKNKVIEEKNIEITDSINYAKRIQNAIIPPSEELNLNLKEGFVFYQPKDIVAGDFYWLQKVEDEVLYAAADCTGHGVPGAMVSVVCNNALNRAVREYNLKEPASILDKTRELVIETFQRNRDSLSMIRDGMDIALCAVNFRTNTIQYAGANNSLYIIRKGELLETKPDKQPVGMHHNQRKFTNHTISLEKGDSIYTFTDGYADQFGGEKGKKFMYKKFKELLISISNKESDEQKEILKKNFDEWKGTLDQIDDVCIIGVKI